MKSKTNQFLTLLIILFSSTTHAQFSKTVGERIINDQEYTTLKIMQPLDLVDNVLERGKIDDVMAKCTFLKTNNDVTSRLLSERPRKLALKIPMANKEPLVIYLFESKVVSDEFKVISASDGSTIIDYKLGIHYWGMVRGKIESTVAISFFEDEMMGIINIDDVTYVLGKMKGQNDTRHIIYEDNDLKISPPFTCYTDDNQNYNNEQGLQPASQFNANNCVRMVLETKYEVFTAAGSSTNNVANFITGVFNQVILLYDNEAVNMIMNELRIWTSPDPYTGPSASDYLVQFRNAKNGNYNGDLAHLIGFSGNGGVAYIDALCNSFNGVGYSKIYNAYSNVPTYSWTVQVLTHEIGHNLGSPHTHACAWNGNNTAIDGCGPAAGYNEGCNAPLPSAGTIMSYCHLVGGVGINFNLGFGPQPGDRIRSEVYNASCLTSCGVCTEGNPCDDGNPCTINDAFNADCDCIGTFTNCDGPGNVDNGITLWLKTDVGVTGTTNVTKWTGQGPYSIEANKSAGGTGPLYKADMESLLNYYPVIDFSSNTADDRLEFSATNMPSGGSERYMTVVLRDKGNSLISIPFVYGTNVTGMANGFVIRTTQTEGRYFSWGNAATDLNYTTPDSIYIMGGAYEGSVQSLYRNGEVRATNSLVLNTATTTGRIGTNFNNEGAFNGHIAEIVVYNKKLNSTEKQRINSYLAIKYGITLEIVDYLASDGSTIWDRNTNTEYVKNIFGIGRDDESSLHQKQSKSVNAGSKLSVSLGSAFAADNTSNLGIITNDASYLIFSDNGSSDYETLEWKVCKTNWVDQNVTIMAEGIDSGRMLKVGSQTFALDQNGNVIINSDVFSNGITFSFVLDVGCPDADADGICDADDQCPGLDDALIGTTCDDGDDCTTGETYDSNCTCSGGTFQDSDADGVCDINDICPGGDDNVDNNNNGIPDYCECNEATDNFTEDALSHIGSGTSSTSLSFESGSKNISFTISNVNQKIDGKQKDRFNDFVVVSYVDSNGNSQNYGSFSGGGASSVNIDFFEEVNSVTVTLEDGYDGNSNVTMNITFSSVTYCSPFSGCPDSDNDGVCDGDDACPGLDDAIIGTACDDGDACTTGETYDNNCNCFGGTFQDSDGDGVCDADDICPGGDDNIDTDNDGIPDACDNSNCNSPLIGQFPQNPLTHSGSSSSSTTFVLPAGSSDPSFTLSDLDYVTEGKKKDRYIEQVTVIYVDGNGNTQTLGVFDGANSANQSLSISGIVSSITLTLHEGYDGNSEKIIMSVDITDVSYCGDGALPLVGSSQDLGFENSTMILYPNPASDKIFINVGDIEGEVYVTFYDILGSKVKEQRLIEQQNLALDVSHLKSNQFYIVVVEGGNHRQTFKLIINE